MKPIIIALLLISSVHCFAQNIEVGISSGSVLSPVMFAKKTHGVRVEKQDVIVSPILQLHASYNVAHWQIGGTIGTATIIGRSYKDYGCILFTAPKTKEEEEAMERERYEITNPSYSIRYLQYLVYINRKIDIGRFALYGGISVGGTKDAVDARRTSEVSESLNGSSLNYSARTQVGCRYAIGKHIGISTEVAASYMNFGKRYFMRSYPVTAGLSYSF